MKQIIIIAGPNGAGKTSFAKQYLPSTDLAYLNADEIAREAHVLNTSPDKAAFAAGRVMLMRLDELTGDGAGVMLETTLATRHYVRRIEIWQQNGYTVSLIYLRLPNVESSLARVAKRVAAGGHDIPEGTVRKRFALSAQYLETLYKPIVDAWYVWDSLEGRFEAIEAWDDQ
jgi:predicted ABC-type ATPase